MKKYVSFMLVFVIMVASFSKVSASPIQRTNEVVQEGHTADQFKAMEVYMSVNENTGKIVFDYNSAKKQNLQLAKETLLLINRANEQVESGDVAVGKNYELVGKTTYEGHDTIYVMASSFNHAYNCGGGINKATKFWWGYSRWACDCESNKISADLNSMAAGETAAGALVALLWVPAGVVVGIDAAYWWYLASRIDANNRGRGVVIDVTWAKVFNINTQK